jgi:hypothetical protein
MTYLHGRVDRNHTEIVAGLRAIGATVQSLADVGLGCPDLLVGWRGEIWLLEIKTHNWDKLTPAEATWHAAWCGRPVAIVHNLTEALAALGATDTPTSPVPPRT